MNATASLIIGVLGALDLATLIMFFVNRHDSKKNVSGKLTALEKDVLRTQLLMLILMRPEAKQEILTLGKHYFGDLHGNWYMTDIFNHWLKDHGDSEPEWFKKEG